MDPTGPAKQWWTQPWQSEDVRAAAWHFASALDESSAEKERRENFLVYASQYLGRPVLSLRDFQHGSSLGADGAPAAVTGRTRNNLTRTLVDTAMSRFAKSETRVQYTTEGGTPAQQERAETATDSANALLEQTESEQELRKGALHACVFDLGATKKIDRNDGPVVEHTPAWELMFEPADAHRGKPTILVHVFSADRDALIAEFIDEPDENDPDFEKLLDAAKEKADDIRQSSSSGMIAEDRTQSDQHCLVYELWRLPVGRRKGRHVVVTEKALLLDEEWTEKRFPFAFFGWSAPIKGAYPESIAAIVSQLQMEIDGLDQRISQCLRLMAVPIWEAEGLPENTGVIVTQLQGGGGAIGDCVQVPPGCRLTRLSADNIMGAELPNRANQLWSRGFQMCGISESSAIGSRPAGLNSAPAQREWNEINQDRLSLVALDYQQAHVDIARLLLEAIAKIPDYAINVKTPNGRWIKKVRAKDLDLDASDYVIERFPIGALPLTPTGKLAAAADLLQMKGITVDEFRDILQFPDLKAKINIARATEKAVEKIIAKMLSTGEYIAPPDVIVADPSKYGVKYATAKWLEGLAEDMPQEQMDLLNDWIDDIKAKSAPPPAPPAMPGVDPTAGTSIAPITPAPLAPPPPLPPQGAIAV